MKKKIIGIVICMLMISSTTTLALTPLSKDEQQIKHQFFDTTPVPLPTATGWIKTFGGAGNDSGASVQQTTDGGYIIGGYTDSYGAGGLDFYLIKTDGNGDTVWEKNFGTVKDDEGWSVQQTLDGGYIIAGSTSRSGGGIEPWLVKTDSSGNKVWDRTFSGKFIDCLFVRQTSDGGYIMTGETTSSDYKSTDVYLLKTDGNGNKIWNKSFGGTNNDLGYAIQQTTDGGYIITGWTWSYGAGEIDAWLIKTDINGTELWNKTFGGTYSEAGRSVQQTTDGGYIITGQYGVSDSDIDVWLVKTDSNGNKLWDKTFGGTNSEASRSVQQTTDGGYIIIGYKYSTSAGYDLWLIKTDSNGNKVWDRTFGGTGDDFGRSVKQTTDGGYIITGYTTTYGSGFQDVWLIKTDSEGKSKTSSFENMWFERLFERFPNAFPILRHLMGY